MVNNNRPRRQRAQRVVVTTTQTAPVPQQNVPRNGRRRRNRTRRNRRRVRGMNMAALTRLSQPGLAFLKCAFAPPNFNTDPGKGIPDRFEGKVVSRKDVLNQSISFTAGQDTFILIAPTPGVAYWSASVPAGTFPTSATTFNPVNYPGFTSMFGTTSTSRSDQVSSFRYASMNVGIYPTSNLMQFAGSITVWKCPVKLSTVQFPVATDPATSSLVHTLVGLDGVLAVGPDNFSESFIKGVFSQSACNEPDFEFNDILEGIQTLPPANVSLGSTGQPFTMDSGAEATSGVVGWGNMDTIVIRVSAPEGAVNSAILKAWSCIEYRPNPNAMLYQFGHDSPPLDEVALQEYRTVARSLPVAVIAAQNASMWERVKSIIKSSLAAASNIPGPIGVAASGISGLSALFEGFGF
uniref:Capsid protein alpha n=1 Tax=Flock house virus TaxID=12287 RepID=UPI000181CE1A|nr:Chain A, Capsid protein alpha [Flock House virus]4FTE_B Chain B, Capsid protein alpha [Flock House virus]4FTE_C Chain C, Capsid protein alpha [Flock House virus]